jgi:hypothetical protein
MASINIPTTAGEFFSDPFRPTEPPVLELLGEQQTADAMIPSIGSIPDRQDVGRRHHRNSASFHFSPEVFVISFARRMP